jgi:hypothetical protein
MMRYHLGTINFDHHDGIKASPHPLKPALAVFVECRVDGRGGADVVASARVHRAGCSIVSRYSATISSQVSL